MNNFKIKNEFNRIFLEYEFKEEDINDTFSEGMIKNNSIDGILPLSFQQIDTKKYYTYNLSNLVSFSKYFENMTQKKEIVDILIQIVNIYKLISEYMIEEKYILLDLNYMFIQPSSMKIYLVCLPIENAKYQLTLGEFIKRFITGVVYKNGEDDFIIKILNFLNMNSSFAYDDLLKLLNQLLNNSHQTKKNFSNNQRENVKIPDGKKCLHCGKINSIDSMYCISCGKKLIPEQKKIINKGKRCSNCGTVNNSDSKFCIKCGNSLISGNRPQNIMNRCPSCGTEMQSGFLFCTKCGTNLKTGKKQENDQLVNKKEEEKKIKKGFIWKKEKKKPENNKSKIPSKKEKIPLKKKRISVSEKIAENDNLEGINNNLVNTYNTQVYNGTYPQTGVLSSDGKSIITAGTDILVDEDEIVIPTLLRVSTSQRVKITSNIFRIGKDETFNDFIIYDNNAISRRHAEISFDNDKYYITDLNSTNKTRVDGKIVSPGYKVELFSQSHIKLANEEFIFEF